MSAIFGIIRFDGHDVSDRDLERMANTLAHRGPHGRKFAVDGSVGLGHCLLRVNVEDRFEAQPLYDAEIDLTLVADCRIDNREELATALGIVASDAAQMPDSAFILNAYRKWGEGCAARLLGDFTFAIWNGRDQKLLLGRDHMGQRSVYYHRGKDFFAFATEIKALWALGDMPRKLSEAQLGKFLVMDTRSHDGASCFEDIYGVMGGTTLSVQRNGTTSLNRYWEAHAGPEHLGRDEAYYVETYRRVFTEAVECRIRRLISPPAVLLSGGYDSSGIAGLCGPILRAQGRKLIAVSSVVAEGYHGPLPCAWRRVDLCRQHMPHIDVHYVESGSADILSNVEKQFLIADGFVHLGHYVTDRLFRQAAQAGAHLIMSGIGGDSTINRRGGDALAVLLRTGQFRRFVMEFGPSMKWTGESAWHTIRRRVVAYFVPRWAHDARAASRREFAPKWSVAAIAPAFARRLLREHIIDATHMFGQPRSLAGVPPALRQWPNATRRWDANEAAARGLDLTMPLMDKRIVEFGLAIPRNLEIRNGQPRDLARRALGDIYPPEFESYGPSQEWLEPNGAAMLDRARSKVLGEIREMTANRNLAKYFDFAKMASALAAVDDGYAGRLNATLALRSFLAAKYVKFVLRDNI